MLVSENSPFREVLSQLVHTKLQLGLISDASCLWIDGSPLVIGTELFDSESLKLGLTERIFQLIRASTKTTSFSINWKDLRPRKTEDSTVIQKFSTLIEMYCPNVEGLELVSLVLEESSNQFEAGVVNFLEIFSSQLRSIQWNGLIFRNEYFFVPDISFCTHIRELTFPFSPQLISFLHTFGSSLASLSVSFRGINKYVGGCIDGYIDGYAEMLDLTGTFGEELYADYVCSFWISTYPCGNR